MKKQCPTNAIKSDMSRTTKTRLWVGTLTATWIALKVHVTTKNGIKICQQIKKIIATNAQLTHKRALLITITKIFYCKSVKICQRIMQWSAFTNSNKTMLLSPSLHA